MISYSQVSLRELVNTIGEDEAKDIIADFSCPKNEDVETFLKKLAIKYDKSNISRTHLIFAEVGGATMLVGYFTLASKTFRLDKDVSKAKRREIIVHSQLFNNPLPAMLLGQIGKNYSDKAMKGIFITGTSLLQFAFSTMKNIYDLHGFSLVYLECMDIPFIREFYESHGFELHVDKSGNPIVNDTKDDLLIYIANPSVLSPNTIK